jgi:hypothetical protein
LDLADGVWILERTPATLRALLAGMPPAWTDATEGPDTWSPYLVEGHLIRGRRLRRHVPTPAFAGVTATISRGRESQGKPLPELLAEFARLRAENLATLEGWVLTDYNLALEGEHPEFGTVTLRQLLATWVAHDLAHLGQISRVMAKQQREVVGPCPVEFQSIGIPSRRAEPE